MCQVVEAGDDLQEGRADRRRVQHGRVGQDIQGTETEDVMRRRVRDQVLILLAIRDVRIELKRVGMTIEGHEILMRLATLYALLNVEQLAECVSKGDQREDNKEAA